MFELVAFDSANMELEVCARFPSRWWGWERLPEWINLGPSWMGSETNLRFVIA